MKCVVSLLAAAVVTSTTVVGVAAAPHTQRQSAPAVTIAAGTVYGLTASNVESFSGIPFAQPPVGQLRLKPPRPYSGTFPGGVFNATSSPRQCPQGLGSATKRQAGSLGLEEDCLTLNVQRPAGTTATSKLPVLFWIYGGGFALGSTAAYDGTQLITHGLSGPAEGHPFIFVAVNYRLGVFGFMGGRELQWDGSTNLGLRDQRLGMEWVADNIAAFGGDPDKVTIWGESAGAISVFDQTIIYNGDNTYKGKPLFRAAIMNSGSVIPAESVSTPKAQTVFNTVLNVAGCGNATYFSKLACLRAAPFEKIQAAGQSLPGLFSYRSLDLAFLPRPDPLSTFFTFSADVAVALQLVAKVPIIIGDLEDEGTLFTRSQSNITNTQQLTEYLQSYFPVKGKDLMPGLVATYPDDPAAGSPFRTGNEYNSYPQQKRLAAILGDITFTLARRVYLTLIADKVPAWSYLDSHLYGTGDPQGTYHGSDLAGYFTGTNQTNVVSTYRTSFISFLYYLNPNKIVDQNWPQYTTDNSTSGRQLLGVGAENNTIIKDDFRQASYEFLYRTRGQIRV